MLSHYISGSECFTFRVYALQQKGIKEKNKGRIKTNTWIQRSNMVINAWMCMCMYVCMAVRSRLISLPYKWKRRNGYNLDKTESLWTNAGKYFLDQLNVWENNYHINILRSLKSAATNNLISNQWINRLLIESVFIFYYEANDES